MHKACTLLVFAMCTEYFNIISDTYIDLYEFYVYIGVYTTIVINQILRRFCVYTFYGPKYPYFLPYNLHFLKLK